MMRYILFKPCLVALLCSTVFSLSALGQTDATAGTSCENPIVVTKDFSMYISEPGTYWFKASTYDLPINVKVAPDFAHFEEDKMDTYTEPKVSVDFSCTTGVYDDPNIQEMITSVSGWGVKVPINLDFEENEEEMAYILGISETYRTLMMQYGITYDVEALVRLDISFPATASLAPDTAFRACADNAYWVKYPDTLTISTSTIDSVYVLPVTEWRSDSIRFRWTGTEKAQLWIGATCGFALSNSDENVLEIDTLYPAGDARCYIDYSSADLSQMVHDWGDGSGVFYARILSSEKAQFIVEPKPIQGAMASAIELVQDKTADVAADDTTQVYYFRKSWNKNSIQLLAATDDTIVAYFGKTLDFYASPTDRNYIGSMLFYSENGQMVLNLTKQKIAEYAALGSTDFVFVRFQSPVATAITPVLWNTDECVSKSMRLLYPNDQEPLRTSQSVRLYTLNYDLWQQNDVLLRWSGVSKLNVYLADTCEFNLTASNKHVLFYSVIDPTIEPICTILADTLRSFADRVSAEDNLYLQFVPKGNGTLYLSQEKLNDPPTDLEIVKNDLWVVYTTNGIEIRVSEPQTLCLYNSLGMLVQTWYQDISDTVILNDLSAGVYVLRGENKVCLIKH